MSEPAAVGFGTPIRHLIRVTGLVQGVGFRPFVHRLAAEMALAGEVGNDARGVRVEVEGPAAAVFEFESRLVAEAPPLARIDGVGTTTLEARGGAGFRIVDSRASGAVGTYVAPDVAVCADCLTELADAGDRRYRYPFINCTNCGPRFTITTGLPYDRPNTTMAGFEMCRDCAREYHDPADRRFHAQPIACPVCGPRIWFDGAQGRIDGTEAALDAARDALTAGQVVAIKGLGGYHLACDATSGTAVGTLRRRKARPGKPFAVMVADLAAAADLALLSDEERALLSSPAGPIVLLRKRSGGVVSDLVAPENPLVGLLLPYTPLHHLLLGSIRLPLVMTSGNLSEEPICYEDRDAKSRLGPLADGWLLHDRPIHVPCDDSVVRVVCGGELPIRRSRGYAPLPVRLPFAIGPRLAAGGDLKNAFCLGSGRDAWMSQHIGDMGGVETIDAFERSLAQFSGMYRIDPQQVITDLHPGYQTRRWAERRAGDAPRLVQHHHAHVASLMAEHGLAASERVIGFAFDGTGYGPDGAIWGGEVLLAGYRAYERAAHLRYVPLPGGDAAVRKPYRAALAHLKAAGVPWAGDLAPVAAASPTELRVLDRQLERAVQCVPTSSMGRLFDSVSSLLGVRHVATYEAEAAVELEVLAEPHVAEARRYALEWNGAEIDPAPMLRAIVADLRSGVPKGPIAAGFHAAIAGVIESLAVELRARTGIGAVALTGGVFQNAVLLRLALAGLADRGLTVLVHRVVPTNDGGLALGQLVASP